MNMHEKAYRQLIRYGFCHFSDDQLNDCIRKARFRARFALVFLGAAVLAYFFVIRPI